MVFFTDRVIEEEGFYICNTHCIVGNTLVSALHPCETVAVKRLIISRLIETFNTYGQQHHRLLLTVILLYPQSNLCYVEVNKVENLLVKFGSFI
jgi:hypothetical protein